MKKIAYIPYHFNPSFDPRNILLYGKLKKIQINNYYDDPECDILVIPPTYDPTNLDIFENKKFKVIYYLCDDYLAYSFFSFKNIFRGLLYFLTGKSKKITFNYKKSQIKLLSLCDAVICSSEQQKIKIKEFNNNCIVFFEGNFHVSRSIVEKQKTKELKIVWEGRSENLIHLAEFKDAFQKIVKNNKVELHIITDLSYPLFYKFFYFFSVKKIKKIFGNLYQENIINKKTNIYIYQWSINTVSTILKSCDISIIPLNKSNPLAMGKSSNKLIHMLRNKLPTLTSDIRSYKNVYEEIGIDFTCKNSSEWVEKINNLINDKYLIEDFTKRSSKLIKDNYSENKFILQWDNLLNNL